MGKCGASNACNVPAQEAALLALGLLWPAVLLSDWFVSGEARLGRCLSFNRGGLIDWRPGQGRGGREVAYTQVDYGIVDFDR